MQTVGTCLVWSQGKKAAGVQSSPGPLRQHEIQTVEKEKSMSEWEAQISNQIWLRFLMLIQTEVWWLEIIEMRQMSRDAANTAPSQQQCCAPIAAVSLLNIPNMQSFEVPAEQTFLFVTETTNEDCLKLWVWIESKSQPSFFSCIPRSLVSCSPQAGALRERRGRGREREREKEREGQGKWEREKGGTVLSPVLAYGSPYPLYRIASIFQL